MSDEEKQGRAFPEELKKSNLPYSGTLGLILHFSIHNIACPSIGRRAISQCKSREIKVIPYFGKEDSFLGAHNL